jgi:hypothetical protein
MARSEPGTMSNPQAGTGASRRLPQIRLRALVAILLLVPPLVLLMVWGNWLVGGNGPMDSLNGPAVALLFLLTLLNLVLKRRKSRWAFSAGEIIAIYVVIAASAGLTGNVWGWGGNLAANIAYPIWQAGPANRWVEIMWPNLPAGLTPMNRDALQGFFLGSASPYQRDILLAWAQPALWWTGWVTATLWVTLCFSVIIRRRWSEEEKLPFPMTLLPLHLTDPQQGLFQSPLWWVGLGGSAALGVLDLVSSFVPSIPTFPTYLDITTFLNNNKPWDAIRTTSLSWGPWQLGLTYLMPADLAFSLIVFNLLWRAEYVLSRMGGWLTDAWGGFPYGDQQVIGAYLSLMASVLWLDRRYLVQVLRRALGLPSSARESGEAFSYRTAVFGGIAGLGYLFWFYQRSGMSAVVAASFIFLFFIMVMAMIRMRAHIGPPSHWMYGTMPEFVLTQFPGTRALGPRALSMIALLRPFMYEQDTEPAPIQLEALRMAERSAVHPTRLAWIVIAAIPFTILCYFWASLQIGYHLGLGAKAYPDMTFVCRQTSDKLDSWLRDPGGPNWSGVESIGIGFAITVLLMAIKLRFPMWPLHPLAFPLAFSWTIDSMIPAVIVTWLAKALLLRYGGLRAHRRAFPFFLGLIVGSATISFLQLLLFRALGIAR